MAAKFIKFKTTAKTVSTNAELVLRENTSRKWLLIQNRGQIAYVGFGDDAGPGGSRSVSSTTGFEIASGESREFSLNDGNLSSEKVYVTSATGNTAILITEGADTLTGFAAFDPPAAGESSSSSSSSSSSASSDSSSSASSDSSSSASSDSSSSASSDSSSSDSSASSASSESSSSP